MPKSMPRLVGKCAYSSWESIGAEPKGNWRLFGKCLKGIGDIFSNAYRIAETLWKCPNKSGDQTDEFHSGSSANRKQENPLSLMPTVSPHISGIFCLFPWSVQVLLNLNTIWTHNKKLKSHQQFFAYFCTFQLKVSLPAEIKLVRQIPLKHILQRVSA